MKFSFRKGFIASAFTLVSALLVSALVVPALVVPAQANWRESLPAQDVLAYAIKIQDEDSPVANNALKYSHYAVADYKYALVAIESKRDNVTLYLGTWQAGTGQDPKFFLALKTGSYKPLQCTGNDCAVHLRFRGTAGTQVLELVRGDLSSFGAPNIGANYSAGAEYTSLLIPQFVRSAQGKTGSLEIEFRTATGYSSVLFNTAGIEFVKIDASRLQ